MAKFDARNKQHRLQKSTTENEIFGHLRHAIVIDNWMNKKHLKNVGPIRYARRRMPIQQVSLPVLSRAACASMSTTKTTTRDRGDRYGPMEWAQ